MCIRTPCASGCGRIRELTGLDVANEDWLMIEIELKLLRLEHALGHDAADDWAVRRGDDGRQTGS